MSFEFCKSIVCMWGCVGWEVQRESRSSISRLVKSGACGWNGGHGFWGCSVGQLLGKFGGAGSPRHYRRRALPRGERIPPPSAGPKRPSPFFWGWIKLCGGLHHCCGGAPPKTDEDGDVVSKKTYHATGHSSKHSPGRVKGRGTDPLYMHAKIVELRGITEIQI